MKSKTLNIKSSSDGLNLAAMMFLPEQEPQAIICFSHGMCEHKERYYNFMQYLTNQGYITLIHDHRGHGASVKNQDDLGYFYDDTSDYIVEDLHDVISACQKMNPDLPVYLFSHSMGTLVARKYLKQYDSSLNKLVLCGAPCNNALAKMGLLITNTIKQIKGEHYRSAFINRLVLGDHDKKFAGDLKNRWLSANESNVKAYNEDALCGFTFTTNGFINLFKLLIGTFDKKGWIMQNPELPIYFIAGEDDPIIGSLSKWQAAQTFLKERGYHQIEAKAYPGLRHEILNEKEYINIYQDVLNFFNHK